MRLSHEAIADFKQAYLQVMKRELSDEQADIYGMELLEFMQMITKPVPKEDEEKLWSLRVN